MGIRGGRNRAKVTFSDAVQSIDNKVKAYAEKNAAARMRARFWTMCVMIAIAAVIFFLGELFSPKTDTVTFEDGCKLTFVEAGTVSAADLDFNVTTRQLTQDEASILFQDLQVTADAVYGEADDSTYRLLGFKGQCGERDKSVILLRARAARRGQTLSCFICPI